MSVFDTMPIFEKIIFLVGAYGPESLTPFIKIVQKCSGVRKDLFINMQSANQ